MPEIQHIWRTIAKMDIGWMVWEVIQVMPDGFGNDEVFKAYATTSDGGYIMATCRFFFTEKSAKDYYNEPGDVYQSVHWLA